ncbi:MAG: B12-binding domain-containing radical SAM protein [Treponema sp.]|nr:B12-binding domain-containing radical SAM protein [Treponema sp.]
MNIKLISPRMSLRPMDSAFKRLMSPPLSLVTIATLTPKEHRVWIEDENIVKIKLTDSPDLVGITVNVDTSERAFEIAKQYRSRGIKVVFGGIHASANPDLMLINCDCVVIGEAEEIWRNLLDDFESNQLRNIYKNDKITSLKNVPLPDWNFVDHQKYLYHNVIVTSRGCPFKCNFCYNSSDYVSNPFRNRPVTDVLEEIENLKTRQVLFIDDNFIGNVEWTKIFVKAIKKKNLVWHAAVSTNIFFHKDLIREFAESGCKSLFIGFESINEDSILSADKKQNKVKEYEELIALLHENGIMVNASMVFGFDYDEPSVFKNTLVWLIKNKVETMTAHILTPYPGTALYKQLLGENRIIDFSPDKYNTSNVVFQPQKMTAEELKNGYLWIYREFYSLKNIIKRRPSNNHLQKPYFLFNLGYRKYGRITSFFGRFGFMSKIGQIARKISYGIG